MRAMARKEKFHATEFWLVALAARYGMPAPQRFERKS
jgi:hypothetical protein